MQLKVLVQKHTFKAGSRWLVFQVMMLLDGSLFLILVMLRALGHLSEALNESSLNPELGCQRFGLCICVSVYAFVCVYVCPRVWVQF